MAVDDLKIKLNNQCVFVLIAESLRLVEADAMRDGMAAVKQLIVVQSVL